LDSESDLRSKADELTLFAIGDVHLGMRPGSLPEGLDHEGVDPRDLTPEAALLAAVECAIEARVDAVVFTGDVVESTNARYEALRPLEFVVRRLLDLDIPVLAVAGNHDVEALPRLARMIEGFELLGEGGQWQTRVIEKSGGKPGAPAVELLGWSFPERQVRNSPVDLLLRNPMAPARSGLARIGLLHADLDASAGHYAPITSRELNESGLDAWLLGHIHNPSLPVSRAGADGASPYGYLGSLVGLDPSEVGPRGPWLVRVNARGEVATTHLPIAPLRWERFEIRVEENDGPEEVGDRLLAEMVRVGEQVRAGGDGPKALGVRPLLVGPTRHYHELHRCIREGRWNGLMRYAGKTLVFVDKVFDRLDLAHDLEALALGDDPAALMAQKLLLLQAPSEARERLIESAREALKGLASEPRWMSLDQERNARDPLADDASVAAILNQAGTEMLNALLEQRAGASGSDA
jgi:exonuclease SbcD